ncbi:MAG: DNA mismatch repair endonuclease MutL, partial [Peptostreptococcales bacterium]
MLQRNKIKMLPEEISNKIAAGEVVDRPVSIVKELVENSIDAMANSIVVEIKEGGKTYIRVSDNGFGIEKESIELAFERHATSKISTADDMEHIHSLGFRGEALASIAAVSHIEIISKTEEEDTGIRMEIAAGQIIDKSEVGSSQGTTIIIKDLFYNVPARLKFLKQSGTEANLIIDLLSKMALAYPHIKFRLISNTKTLFVTNGSGDILKNIRSIYKNECPEDLLMVTGEESPYQLKAYISKPSFTKSNRKYQIFFVNGRYIHNTTLEKSIYRAYKELLFNNHYPVIFLFL